MLNLRFIMSSIFFVALCSMYIHACDNKQLKEYHTQTPLYIGVDQFNHHAFLIYRLPKHPKEQQTLFIHHPPHREALADMHFMVSKIKEHENAYLTLCRLVIHQTIFPETAKRHPLTIIFHIDQLCDPNRIITCRVQKNNWSVTFLYNLENRLFSQDPLLTMQELG